MAEDLFNLSYLVGCLLVPLALPLVAQWCCGPRAALLVLAAELGVSLLFLPWEQVLYVSYLVVLLALPSLAQWRWGLRASLKVTVAELPLMLLIIVVAERYSHYEWLRTHPPKPVSGPPDFSGLASFVAILVVWGIIPGIAALMGSVLPLVWSATQAIRRSIANRWKSRGSGRGMSDRERCGS